MDTDQEVMQETNINNGPSLGKRYIQASLLFLCIATESLTRFCLAVSIVAMTDNSTSTNPNIPTYKWSDSNVILSSFYWGYMILPIVIGQMAKSYGAKWPLFGTMIINAAVTVIIPQAAEWFGSKGVMACRIIQGLSQGGVMPSCQTMLGKWAPKSERGRMTTFVYSGIGLGHLTSSILTGYISQSYLGWPVSFYIFGGSGFLWSAAWFFYGHSTPASHPYISAQERKYIEVSLDQENDAQSVPTPWKAMLKSSHFWAIIIPSFITGYGIILQQNEIPTYLKKAMKYNIAASGSLSALSSGAGILAMLCYGPISDFLIERRYLSRLNTRKAIEIWACYGGAASLLILAYLNESQAHLSVVFVTFTTVFFTGMLFGHILNSIDLSPRFSGIILGVGNSLSCVAAIFAPLSVQYVVTDETNTSQWRLVFIAAALSYLVPSTIFVLFASADRQWWDDGSKAKVTPSDLEKQKECNKY